MLKVGLRRRELSVICDAKGVDWVAAPTGYIK
jgi:hypothetical protein